MIQKQKKLLFNPNYLTLAALILIQLSAAFFLFRQFWQVILSFYLLAAVFVSFSMAKARQKVGSVRIKNQDLLESINITTSSMQRLNDVLSGLNKKKMRYFSLEHTVGVFNQGLKLEEAGKSITEESFRLFGESAAILLYILNKSNNRLELFSSKMADSKVVVKEKYGDLFNDWAVKHSQPLLVEDVCSDFRFDPEKVKKGISRPLGSLMASPLIADNRFIGILRAESSFAGLFNSEDLRFLSIISSLAVIALENSLLFEEAEELSIRDGLTGLYLRRYLDERGREELQFARSKHYDVSVLLFDVDDFKAYNDRFGHRCGDIVLTHISNLLKKMLQGQNCIISRFGGEEFVVLLPNTKKKQAASLAEQIRKDIQSHVITLRRDKTNVTVSIGVASYSSDADSWIDLIRKADNAMYRAKQAGKNKVICS